MAVSPKIASSLFYSSGLLSYFTFSEMVNTAKASIDVVGGGVENSWNKSEDTYQQVGESVGGVIGSAAMVAANLGFQLDEQRKYGFWTDGRPLKQGGLYEGVSHGGNHYVSLDNDLYRRVHLDKHSKLTEGAFLNEEENNVLVKALKSKTAEEGIIRTTGKGSKFIASEAGSFKGMIKGAMPFVAAIAVGAIARGVLGFGGSLLDQAFNDERRARRVHYDTRFFNTQQDEMSNYQQLGAAMNNYSQRMISTARIYHSR